MKLITNLTLTICVLSLCSTAILMLAPDRYRREIRSVVSLVTVVSVGAIILGADYSDLPALPAYDFDAPLAASDELVQRELESRLSDYLFTFLEEEGITAKKVEVGTTIDNSRSIFITKASLWLDHDSAELVPFAEAKIKEKIGDIEVKIIYEDS